MNITVSTTPKYYHKQTLNKKTKIDGRGLEIFFEKVTGPWKNLLYGLLGFNFFKKKFGKPSSPPTAYLMYAPLFHSVTTDGKKLFRKYSLLTLNKGKLLGFLVVHVDKTLGIISKVKRDVYFFEVWKTSTIFGTIAIILVIQDLLLDKSSLLRNLW